MTLVCEEPEADEGTTESEEGFLDLEQAIQTAAEAAERVQPADRPLDEPPVDTQTATVFGPAFGQDRGDAQPPQQDPERLGVVPAVPLNPLGESPVGPRLPADRRHGHQDFEQLGDL